MTCETTVYGTALSPADTLDASAPLPGGWTASDLDLSPWVRTIFWEVQLRANRPAGTARDTVSDDSAS
jgi:hypothetical protein